MMLIVTGRFDEQGGKPSGYAKKLFAMAPQSAACLNGGHWKSLQALEFASYGVIIWLADVPNHFPKLIEKIKSQNPHCILISSKNNISGECTPFDLVSRALRTRSSLLLEFTKDKNEKTECTIWDPLGNVYLQREEEVLRVRTVLFNRIIELLCTKRVATVPSLPSSTLPSYGIPNEQLFFAMARDYATKLHSLVHAVNPTRFLGNLSFRCQTGFPSFRCQTGFPSFRGRGNIIYVSKRNIDKRKITKESFVPVGLYSETPVEYNGDHKPSVDAPIQVRLYRDFPKLRFMIHTHAYINGASTTPHVLPCGDIREAEAIRRVVDRRHRRQAIQPHETDVAFFLVNLKGHGSIAAATELADLREIQYVARPLPELI